MSSLGNKEIMAKNIKYYMEKEGLNATDFANKLNFKYSTVLDWLKAKTYPRIDRIEIMANYFGISKADLVEEPFREEIEKQPSDISTKLEEMMKELSNQQEALMFRGEPMDDETKEAVLLSMQQAMRFAEMSMKNKDKEE